MLHNLFNNNSTYSVIVEIKVHFLWYYNTKQIENFIFFIILKVMNENILLTSGETALIFGWISELHTYIPRQKTF